MVLTGGTDNMSQAPWLVRGIRFGTKLGVDQKMEDSLWVLKLEKSDLFICIVMLKSLSC